MTANLPPYPKFKSTYITGDAVHPLVGGKLYTYGANSSTPLATSKTRTGSNDNTNPVILDANGEADVWLTLGSAYKLVLTNSSGTQQWSVDYVYGAEESGLSATLRSDLATASDTVKGAFLVGSKVPLTGGLSRTLGDADQDIYRLQQWAVGDGSTDDSTAVQSAITAVGGLTNGGTLDGGGKTYLLNDAGVLVNLNRVLIQNATFKRTSSTTGYLVRFASTANTTGGGLRNVRFVGVTTQPSGNAALAMGSTSYAADNYILDNIEADSFSQYGVAIEAGSHWKISNIRVINHGCTTGTLASCMGFYVYPKLASFGGTLSNIYSEISAASMANAGTNSAAMKIQTHQGIVANNLVAKNGSEECMAIDSPQGIISNVLVYPYANGYAGLVVGNYNPAHSFSGQIFTLDGAEIFGGFDYDLVIGGGTAGQYKLTGCVLRNIKGETARSLNLTNWKNCTFENWDFADIRISTAYNSQTANVGFPSIGNIYRNITVRGGAYTGVLAIEGNDSTWNEVGGVGLNGDTVATIEVIGDSNRIICPFMHHTSSNAIKVTGDSNEFWDISTTDVGGYSVWFPVGSDNNTIYSGRITAGTGLLDSGANNLVYGQRKLFYGAAAPVAGTWAIGDQIINTDPTAGGGASPYIGWACTAAGTPGTWKTFGPVTA